MIDKKATELTEGQKEIKQTLSNDKHIIWLGAADAGKTFSLATVVEQSKTCWISKLRVHSKQKAADF